MENIRTGFLQVLKRSGLLTTCTFIDNRGVKSEANEWSQLSMEKITTTTANMTNIRELSSGSLDTF
jgi:hypothetical protein